MTRLIIAIDGPAGAGKTTVAKSVAQKLGIYHLDSGAMYRAVALAGIREGVNPKDARQVAALVSRIKLVYIPLPSGYELFLNGEEVSEQLRSAPVTRVSSQIAVHTQVRQYLVNLQRELGSKYDLVMEGRDIGSVVFPDANYKFYLDADIEERARRKLIQDRLALTEENLTKAMKVITQRDRRDSTRDLAPLVVPEDAYIIDSTYLNIDQVVEKIFEVVKRR
jgi:cytidylate kinase